MHISNTFKEAEKVNIDSKKANIEDVFTVKTASHIQVLQAALGSELVYGRSDVQRVLGLKPEEALRCCAKWQNMESLSQCPDMEKASIDSGIRKVETMEFQTCSVRPKSY